MASSSSASISGGDDGDPFDIPAKGASIERLRRWRKVVLVLNASRRFRYTLDVKKEESKEEVRREIRAHATVLRADSHFKEAGRASFQSRETAVASADRELGFGIQEDKLTTLTRDHNSSALEQYGGISGIAHKLNTDTDKGISGHDSDLTASRNAFGSNTYPRKKQRSFLAFMWDACKDPSLIILMVAAVLSVALGITSEGTKEGWYDGASIAFAVLLVVFVTALNDYKQARQFQFLNEEKENKKLEVVRGGRRIMISTYDLVVGDVVPLKIGDEVPADGIVISGHSFWIDESSMTGEPALEWKDQSTFLTAGCKVADGYGMMLVTAVGINTLRGLLMASISDDSGVETPLQVRLNGVATFIGRLVFCVALAVVAVLLARYFTGHTHNPDGSAQYVKGKIGVGQIILVVVRIFTVVVSVVVVAVPEGLPLAVTLTLAFSLRKMIKGNALLRRLPACETMGSATTICCGKTGTLTLNQMRVVEAYFGGKKMDSPNNAQILPTNVTSLITEGIAQNTTGSIFEAESGQEPEVTGSPTEKAILYWGLELGMRFNETRSKSSILHVSPFNSEKKRSGIAVHLDGDEVHIHWKGAAEIVLDSCTSWLDHDGLEHSMTPEKVAEFRNFIEDMALASLRCVAFAYSTRGMDDVPNENQRPRWKLPEDNLIMLGIVGIKDPCRPGVQDAIRLCTAAGIKVRMVTGDNLQTARAIALECGIVTDHDVSEPNNIIEGKTFRALSDSAREEVADKIVVMGNSSPNDKLLLINALKKRGHVVAVTGDGANDAPALLEADIGLSMGIQGTEVAKESSDIIILDDNFTSVVRVVRWGRSVYANIQRFLQFQFTVNIATLIINMVVAFSSGDMPLNAVQLLWVNIVIDTLGALALVTEPPSNRLMQRRPIGKREPLITNIMWRNLIIMVCFQVSVLLTLNFKGKRLPQLKNDNPAHAHKLKNTFIFNTFVLFQVFNAFNSRKLDELNIFKSITRNHLFVAIIGITVILQALIIEFFGKFASTVKLSWQLWLISIGLAFFCWPLSLVGKLIPVPADRPFGELISCCGGDRPFREYISRCGGCCVVACTCLPVVIGSVLAWLALAFANL